MIRLYRFFLRLYPERFRDEFGDEMVELFADQLRDAKARGGLSVVRLGWRTLRGLATTAPSERLEVRRTRRRPRARLSRVDLGTRWADELRQDLRFSCRALLARPALALTIVATLGLGIGANTAMFSLVDEVLGRAAPFRDPERLVVVSNRYDTSRTSSSPPDFIDRRDRSEVLESIAAFSTTEANLAGQAEPEPVRESQVTSAFFQVLGVAPSPPLRFAAVDAAEPDHRVVLSHGLWLRRFGGDPSAVGRTIRLDGEARTIAAVMPKGFDYPRGTDVWTARQFRPDQLADDYRGNEFLTVVGRMRDGSTIEETRAEMDAIAAGVIERVPEKAAFLTRNGWGAAVSPLTEEIVGSFRPALLMLWGAVAIVLLIVCVNVANLLLARSERRAEELSLRRSLGASGARLARQLLTESGLLALLGTVAGLGIARALLWSLPSWVPGEIPGILGLGLDARVLTFSTATGALAALVCGVAPAWRGAAGRSGGRRLTRALVVNEVALAVMLLMGAALLVKSFRELSAIEPGFHTTSRVRFLVSMTGPRYAEAPDRARFAESLLSRLRDLPETSHAGASFRVPLDGETWTATYYPDTYVAREGEPTPGADVNVVSDGYFAAMGVPLLRGREFSAEDDADGPRVAIVDADKPPSASGPGAGAVGANINLAGPGNDPVLRRIVGVVGRVKNGSLDEPGRTQLYFAASQVPPRRLSFTVAGRGDASAVVASARRELAAIDADLPLYGVQSLEELLADATAIPRFHTTVLGGFSLLALALAALGVYGVLAYSVSTRTREIGTRIALGARAGRVTALVMGQAAAMIVPGPAAGPRCGRAGAPDARGAVPRARPERPHDHGTHLRAPRRRVGTRRVDPRDARRPGRSRPRVARPPLSRGSRTNARTAGAVVCHEDPTDFRAT